MAGILICDQIQNSANTLLINSGALAGNTVGTAQLQSGISVAANTITASAMTVGGTAIGAGNSSTMKNRIINGAMVISQRNGTSSATSGGYILDRWSLSNSQNNKFTLQQNQNSVTPPAGFVNYLGATTSSAYSVGASDYFGLYQPIEGYNIADLGWGTANAKTVTLSFWVQSSLTGTFGGALQNGAFTRSYPFSYTISAANTWTQISVTIAGDTSGTWVSNNAAGLNVWFGLGAGTTVSGTAGSWSGNFYAQPTSTVSVVGTASATWYVTGVQLEVGSSATGYEYRQYGTELQLCQRYYEVFGRSGVGSSRASALFSLNFGYSVAKRAAPTIAQTTTVTFLVPGIAGYTANSISASYSTTSGVGIDFNMASAGSGSYPAIYGNGGAIDVLTASAEL